jgi:hypothetical protein
VISVEYIAGFFDGEGYVTIRRSNRTKQKTPAYRMGVGFVNKYLPLLQEIQERFGGRLYPKARRKANHAPAWELFFTKQHEAAGVLEAMLPHLKIKRAQAELGLAFVKLGKMKKICVGRRPISYFQNGRQIKGHTAPILELVPGEVAVREDFKQQLSKLNARSRSVILPKGKVNDN